MNFSFQPWYFKYEERKYDHRDFTKSNTISEDKTALNWILPFFGDTKENSV